MVNSMRRSILWLWVFAAAAGVNRAEPSSARPLVDRKSVEEWEFVGEPASPVSAVCHYTAEGSLAVVGRPVGFLATKTPHRNYRLHAEWRWPADAAKNSNGGVLIHIASGPKDRAWPLCFQVQTKPSRAGDLLPMAGATFAEKLSTPPQAKTAQLDRRADSSEKPFGEWNVCDIVCRDGMIEVTVNGVLQNRVTQASPAEGKIGFQLEGTPYELRNVQLVDLE